MVLPTKGDRRVEDTQPGESPMETLSAEQCTGCIGSLYVEEAHKKIATAIHVLIVLWLTSVCTVTHAAE